MVARLDFEFFLPIRKYAKIVKFNRLLNNILKNCFFIIILDIFCYYHNENCIVGYHIYLICLSIYTFLLLLYAFLFAQDFNTILLIILKLLLIQTEKAESF